jgi:hypothetical protein
MRTEFLLEYNWVLKVDHEADKRMIGRREGELVDSVANHMLLLMVLNAMSFRCRAYQGLLIQARP